MINCRKWEWRNNKTGDIYYRLGAVINATNSCDGQRMILYENKAGDVFVRDDTEFLWKFTMVKDHE